MKFLSIFRLARDCSAEASKLNLHGSIYCDASLSICLFMVWTTTRIQGLVVLLFLQNKPTTNPDPVKTKTKGKNVHSSISLTTSRDLEVSS